MSELFQKFDLATGKRLLKAANAADIVIDVTDFDGNLTSSETDLQKALEKIDDLEIGGGGDTANVQTLTANLSLAANCAKYQLLDPNGANRAIYLPTTNVAVGKVISIRNTYPSNSMYNYYLAVESAIQKRIDGGAECSFIWSGIKWINLDYEYSINLGTSGYNNAPNGIGILGANNSLGVGIGGSSNYTYGTGLGFSANSNYNYGTGLGYYTTCNGNALAVAIGAYSAANRYGELAKVANNTKKNLWNIVDWWKTSASNTAVELFLDGATKRYILLVNSAVSFTIDVLAKTCVGASPAYAKFKIEGIISKGADNSTTQLVYSNVTTIYRSDENMNCYVTADATNGTLNVFFQGIDGYTMKVNAVGNMNEIRCD